MEDRCLYVKVSTALSKALLRHAFVDLSRMEFIGDIVYQIEIFACSSTLFSNEGLAILYFQCENLVGCDILRQFLRTLLVNDVSSVICRMSKYCCDHISAQGFCIWHV